MAENLSAGPGPGRRSHPSADNPYHAQGGIAILRGNLAPDGAVVKQSAVDPEMLVNEGERPGL